MLVARIDHGQDYVCMTTLQMALHLNQAHVHTEQVRYATSASARPIQNANGSPAR